MDGGRGKEAGRGGMEREGTHRQTDIQSDKHRHTDRQRERETWERRRETGRN